MDQDVRSALSAFLGLVALIYGGVFGWLGYLRSAPTLFNVANIPIWVIAIISFMLGITVAITSVKSKNTNWIALIGVISSIIAVLLVTNVSLIPTYLSKVF